MSQSLSGVSSEDLPFDDITAFFKALDAWVVVKNADLIGNLRRGGDCDIVVENEKTAIQKLSDILGCPSFACDRGYVVSFFYQWGSIDIIRSFRWRGVNLIFKDVILESAKIGSNGWPVVAEEIEVCISILSSLLWGGFLKTRYWGPAVALWNRDPVLLEKALIQAVGPSGAAGVCEAFEKNDPEVLVGRINQVRRAVALFHFQKRPVRIIIDLLASFSKELELIFSPPIPVVFVVGGTADEFKDLIVSCSVGSRRLPGIVKSVELSRYAGFFLSWWVRCLILGNARFRAKCGHLIFHVTEGQGSKFLFQAAGVQSVSLKYNPEKSLFLADLERKCRELFLVAGVRRIKEKILWSGS